MLALDDGDHPAGVQALHHGIGHLGREPLLHLWTAGVDVDQPGDLAQPGDPAVSGGDVGHVCHTDEGQQMVFAERVHLDVAHEHHLVMRHVEGGGQDLGGVLAHPAEQFASRLRHPGGSLAQPVSIRILTDGQQELTHCSLGPDDVDTELWGGLAHPINSRPPTRRVAHRRITHGWSRHRT